MYCSNCGYQSEENDRFCMKCGTTLIPEQPPIESASEPETTPAPEAESAPVPAAEPVYTPVAGPAPVPVPAKKGRLRVPIIIMCLLAVIGIGAFFMFRAYTDPAQPWFTVQNGTLIFDETARDYEGTLNVPSAIAGKPVKKIGTSCFGYSTTVTEITVTEGVEKVGALAFAYTTGLKAVNLPDSVTSIGILAFAGSQDLEAVRLGPSIEYLDATAFMGCPKLQHIFFHGTAQQWEAMYEGDLPEGVTVYLADGNLYEAYDPN